MGNLRLRAKWKERNFRLRVITRDKNEGHFLSMNPASGQKAVLVVEDCPDDTLLIRRAARKICPEINFSYVEGGSEALDFLHAAQNLPDAILVDVRLRIMTGFELVQRIREMARLAGAKIVMWSGGAEPDLMPRALKAGADFFLNKGASYDELFAQVKQICDLAKEAGEEAA